MTINYRQLDPDTERQAFYDALVHSHLQRISVAVYEMDGDQVSAAADVHVLAGQVDVDMDADVLRQLTLTLAGHPPFSPTDAGERFYADRMVGLTYDIWVEELDDWVSTPVFLGPISRAERNADSLTIEAQSKEVLMLPPVPVGRGLPAQGGGNHQPASEKTVDLIKELAKTHGESSEFLRIPPITNATKVTGDMNVFKAANVSNETGVWPLLQDLAALENHQLLYDTEGYLWMRPWRDRVPRWAFHDGEDGDILTEPYIEWDLSTFYNTVTVDAKAPKAADQSRVRATKALLPAHPLSAQSLGRNGVKRTLLFTEKLDARMKESEAEARAATLLKRYEYGAMQTEFTALPIPFLEPGDLVSFKTQNTGRTHIVELRKFSLPLAPNGAMSIGFNTNTSPPLLTGKQRKKMMARPQRKKAKDRRGGR